MKRPSVVSLALFAAVLLTMMPGCAGEPCPYDAGPSRAFFLEMKGGNGAVLANGDCRSRELWSLLSETDGLTTHACWYHLQVHFEVDPYSYQPFYHNLECEEYSRHDSRINYLMGKYHEEVVSSPTHRIFDVVLPAGEDPMHLARRFEESGFPVLFLRPPHRRGTCVDIETTEAADLPSGREARNPAEDQVREVAQQRLNHILADLEASVPLVWNEGPRQGMFAIRGGRVEHTWAVEACFDYGFQLQQSHVGDQVTLKNVRMPTEFTVQVLVPVDDLDGVSHRISDLVPEVVRVEERPAAR